MPFESFYDRFPEIAMKETREIIILNPQGSNLPRGNYSFVEMYCNEAGCDCRRVFFSVFSSHRKKLEAVITYGWEEVDYYADWLIYSDDPEEIAELKGPALNSISPQSEYAPALLELFKKSLLPDKDYIERIKRHYAMFRETVDVRLSRHERREMQRAKKKRRR
jgi:hypothetical protein